MSNPIAMSFPLEKPNLKREIAQGYYSSTLFLIAKFLIEVPTAFLQVLITLAIATPIIKLQGNFFYNWIILVVLGLVSSSLAILIGSSVNSVKQAMSLNPVITVPQILLSGFLVPSEELPSYLSWLQYFCQLKYAVDLFCISEFDDDKYAHVILDRNDIKKSKTIIYFIILFGIFLFYRIIAGFVLSKDTKKF